MAHLRTVHFDIITDFVKVNGDIMPSEDDDDDIRHTLIEKRHHADGYIDYHGCSVLIFHQCHVDSVLFIVDRLFQIKHSFPGGTFHDIRMLHIHEDIHQSTNISST